MEWEPLPQCGLRVVRQALILVSYCERPLIHSPISSVADSVHLDATDKTGLVFVCCQDCGHLRRVTGIEQHCWTSECEVYRRVERDRVRYVFSPGAGGWIRAEVASGFNGTWGSKDVLSILPRCPVEPIIEVKGARRRSTGATYHPSQVIWPK